MAFDPDGLQRIGGANSDSRAVWVYASTEDAVAAIVAADYFLDRIDEMKLQDIVFVIDSAGVVTLSYVLARVLATPTITLAPGNTVAAA